MRQSKGRKMHSFPCDMRLNLYKYMYMYLCMYVYIYLYLLLNISKMYLIFFL